jgi:hypothetical protein
MSSTWRTHGLDKKAGMQNAYAIVNNFRVGAAVLTERLKIYQGCNTQSVISFSTSASSRRLLSKSPVFIIGQDFICRASSLLRGTFHQALEINRAVFAGEMTVT